jgi:hypothetical protein
MALLEGGVEEWMEVRPRTLAHKSLCGSGVLSGFEVVLFPSLPSNAFLPFPTGQTGHGRTLTRRLHKTGTTFPKPGR